MSAGHGSERCSYDAVLIQSTQNGFVLYRCGPLRILHFVEKCFTAFPYYYWSKMLVSFTTANASASRPACCFIFEICTPSATGFYRVFEIISAEFLMSLSENSLEDSDDDCFDPVYLQQRLSVIRDPAASAFAVEAAALALADACLHVRHVAHDLFP